LLLEFVHQADRSLNDVPQLQGCTIIALQYCDSALQMVPRKYKSWSHRQAPWLLSGKCLHQHDANLTRHAFPNLAASTTIYDKCRAVAKLGQTPG